MEKMHGKRNERCWHDVGGSKQESSSGGCLSVAYTLTGVRGNDDDDVATLVLNNFDDKRVRRRK